MTGITQRPGGFSYQRMTNVSPATWQVFSPAGRVAALTYSARDAERVADALGYQHPPAAEGVQAGEVYLREQPCGCRMCVCEDEKQCQGCGAKHCGNRTDHPAYVKQHPEAGAFDTNFLRSVASLCRAAYDLCQPKPQRTPEDPREHHGELCLSELASIADEIERRLAAAEAVKPVAVDEAMVERIAALLHEEATAEPWTVAGVEHPGPDRDYYRGLASKVAALITQQQGGRADG